MQIAASAAIQPPTAGTVAGGAVTQAKPSRRGSEGPMLVTAPVVVLTVTRRVDGAGPRCFAVAYKMPVGENAAELMGSPGNGAPLRVATTVVTPVARLMVRSAPD